MLLLMFERPNEVSLSGKSSNGELLVEAELQVEVGFSETECSKTRNMDAKYIQQYNHGPFQGIYQM